MVWVYRMSLIGMTAEVLTAAAIIAIDVQTGVSWKTAVALCIIGICATTAVSLLRNDMTW